MAKKTRKRFTAPEKVAILRLHLLEHTPVSDLCDQHGIHPTMFYRGQKEFLENASAAFEAGSRQRAAERPGGHSHAVRGKESPDFGGTLKTNLGLLYRSNSR